MCSVVPNPIYFDQSNVVKVHCFIAVQDLHSVCANSGRALTLHTSPVTIMNTQAQRLSCLQQPQSNTLAFFVKTSPGQNLNITLIDFGAVASGGWHSCVNYGRVIESKTQQQTMICGGQERRKPIMVSNSNQIEIRLEKHIEAQFALNFQSRYTDYIRIST